MSYETITKASSDNDLRARIQAGVNKEANSNPTLGASVFGQFVVNNPWTAYQALIWPIAIDNEAAYEYAVNAGNPFPGNDPGVITDANIASGIQVHWPEQVPDFLKTSMAPMA
jgi:hypothetical protein